MEREYDPILGRDEAPRPQLRAAAAGNSERVDVYKYLFYLSIGLFALGAVLFMVSSNAGTTTTSSTTTPASTPSTLARRPFHDSPHLTSPTSNTALHGLPSSAGPESKTRFVGKVVLVTGGSTGIGYSTALLFAQEGARVVIANRNTTTGIAAQKAINNDPLVIKQQGTCVFKQTDVQSQEQVRALIHFVQKTFGTLHIAVNNAGALGFLGVATDIPDFLHRSPLDVMQTNFYGTLFSMIEQLRLWDQEFASESAAEANGLVTAASRRSTFSPVIVNVGSVESLSGFPGSSVYAASKFAIEGLTKSIAGEYAGPPEKTNKPRVRVNMVAPGCISTPMVWNLAKLYYRGEQVWDGPFVESAHDPLFEKYFDEVLRNKFPGARIGRPEDIAAAIAFLSSDAADFISGTTIVVDNTFLSTATKFEAAK